jgi:uncharacterized protein HemX
METEEQQPNNRTGLIVFLLIAILGVLVFMVYMIYQNRQKTITQRISQAVGIKKKSNLQNLKKSGKAFLQSIRQEGQNIANDLRKSFKSGRRSSVSSPKKK